MGVAVCGSAWALSLGRISLQSGRGEPLRAEIELVGAEETQNLAARIVPPEAFGRAGVNYSPALAAAHVSLQQRADGQPVLRISSDQPVQDAFLDLILEVDWASGRLTREYTLLFEAPQPVAQAASAPVPLTAPLLGAAPPEAPLPTPSTSSSGPVTGPATEAAPSPAASARPNPAEAKSGRYVVRRGDTLSGVAARQQAAGVSLDQMLVALYRSNPHAFIGQNMNRLRADVVLNLPTAQQAAQVARGEARQVVRMQSADFNAYRQRLAGSVPPARVEDSVRRSGGAVEAAVEDRRAPASVPDRLHLSRGDGAGLEARLAREAERREQAQRVAELSRNVEELRRLAGGSPNAPGAAPASAPVAAEAAASGMPASAPEAAASSAEAVAAASAPASAASAATAAASAGSAVVDVMPPVATNAAEAEADTGLLGLLSRPWVLAALAAGGLGVAAVLALLARRRRAKSPTETSFMESRLQAESFFGHSGGQQVDTGESKVPASAMHYTLSQLDAIGDVDPVAEADVYLAYGRDLQAEEILKEAMHSSPQRLPVRLKLLEVYAKRHDKKAFEQLAQEVQQLTQGQGEDWAKACELGLQIDPDNPLYATASAAGPASRAPSAWQPSRPPAQPAGAGLDLDLSRLDDVPAPSAEQKRPDAGKAVTAAVAVGAGAAAAAAAAAAATPAQAASPVPAQQDDPMADMDFDTEVVLPSSASAAPKLPFALDSLSLDLDETSTPSVLEEMGLSGFGTEGDPLERKLELAGEFVQIGDAEGARDLLQEVVAQASGDLKTRAEGMLASLV
ncbi:hypothetical protein HHL10_11065 [Azohydromonas sp. G-1-1-14]|uniref:FimV N-terminal domain-containing protein n=2 Tax=Azohydromonas caseinilytica TaxID=2728836 RepID=A0A848F601_9BURK|nr:hypothetical protein [Azohydromonas caseinilytica]